MVEETLSRRAAPSFGRAFLAGLVIAVLAASFAWTAPERNGWPALALGGALVLDALAQLAGALLARRGPAPRIAAMPSLVLAFGPAAGLGAFLFAGAVLLWPPGFPPLASALAGLIAMGALARLVVAWIVLRAEREEG